MAVSEGGNKEGEQDWKATITFFILFLSLFAATLPSITVNFIINRVYTTSEIPPVLYITSIASTMVLTILPITDPIVIMRNRDVKDILQELRAKVFQKWCTKNEHAEQ